MRISFLSDNFPPETNAPANRTHEHTREWARLGHDVTVVTCFPNFPKGVLYPGYRNRPRQIEWFDGVQVVRVWTYIAPNRGTFRRTLDYLSFLLVGGLGALLTRKPDVVIATSPQFFAAVAGYVVAKIRRVPFVFELRDLWPESVTAVGASVDSRLIRLMEKLARYLYLHADLMVPVTQSFAAHLISIGVPQERICVITNGIETEGLTVRPRSTTRAEEGIPESSFLCAYVGTLGMAHGLGTILSAARSTKKDPGLHYVLLGEGAEKNALRERIRSEGLTNVTLLDGRSRNEALSILEASDVSLVLLKNSPLFETVIPSKIFDAMALKKPVILGVRGESRRIVVDEASCGIAFEPGNADELVAAINTLRRDPEQRSSLGESGFMAVETRYQRRVLAQRMIRAIENLVLSKNSAHPGQRC